MSAPLTSRLTPGLALAVLALGAPAVGPDRAAAQDLLPAALGGAAGLAAGGYVSIGIWTAKARWNDEYLYSARDALGWEATPVLVGAATGAAVGFFQQDRLRQTVIGGAVGWFVGTGIGMTLGAARWRPPEGRWAGGVIGGAAGLLLGSTVGLLLPVQDDGAPGEAAAFRASGIPISVTLRFR